MTQRIARTLLIASAALVLVGMGARPAAPDQSVSMVPLARLTESDAMAGNGPLPAARPAALSRRVTVEAAFLPGDEDQPAGACWLDNSGSCLCSGGSVEDLMTPDFMRVLLKSWRDTGRLTTAEWLNRLRQVDIACGSQSAAP